MFTVPVPETERLIMREMRAEDFENYAKFYETERSNMRGGPLNREEAWREFACEVGHWHLRGYGFWALEEKQSGECCGLTGLWNPEGSPAPEVGWVVWGGFEGKGIAHEAALRARAYAYETLGWPQIVSCISDGNVRSIALAERMGAKLGWRQAREGRSDFLVYVHPKPEGQ